MRNLKRALSMALAAIMVLGLMVVGASAASFNDFTDKDEVTHKDAVAMITELGILAGLPDGSFGPTQNIDRASFARLVCVVLNGGKEPTLGNLGTSFTDTKGHWAEKYIAYCVEQGIIAGRGNGTFGPSDNVTGSEAAKMLLVALGYNATYEGIGGATWQTTTDVRANQAGLYKDLETMNTSAPLTRDDACQMIYNALMATEVKYELVPSISADGQISMVAQRTNVTKTVGGNTKDVTLLSDKFNTVDVDAAVMTKFTYNEVKDQYTYTFTTKVDNKDVTSEYTTELDFTDLFGQNVKVIAKADGTVYGMYAEDSTVLASGSKDLIGDIASDGTSVKIDGTSYKIDSKNIPAKFYKTGESAGTLSSVDSKMYNFSLIDNDGDNKGDLLVVTPFDLTQVTFVGKDSVTFATGMISNTVLGNKKTEDINVYEGIAKNDYVIYVAAAYSNDGVATYTQAEVKTGTVSGTKGTKDVMIDGKWLTNESKVAIAANDTIDYIAFGGVIYYAKVTDGNVNSKDIAFVITADTENQGSTLTDAVYKAKLIFTDGTKKTVTVTNKDVKTEMVGKMVTYKVNSDDEYTLTLVSADNKAGYDNYATANAAISDSKVKIGNTTVAEDAIVFLAQIAAGGANASNDAKVITGKEAGKLTGTYNGAVMLSSSVDGFTEGRVVVMSSTEKLETPVLGSNYAYLLVDAYVSNDGKDDYTNYTLWTVNGQVTAQEKGTENKDLKAGAVVTYDSISDGTVKNVTEISDELTADAVTGYRASTNDVQFLYAGAFEITKDTTVLYVDTKDHKGVEGGSIALADKPVDAYVNNVLVKVANKDLALVIVDVNNKLDDAFNKVDGTLGASATSDQINSALDLGDVTLSAQLTNKVDVVVPAGRTLTVKAGGVKDSTITAVPKATVKVGDNELVGAKGATSDKNIVLTLNANGAFDVTCEGTLTVNANLTLGANDKLTNVKLVEGKEGVKLTVVSGNAVKGVVLTGSTDNYTLAESATVLDGTYTWTTGKTSAEATTTVSGWLKQG